MNLMLEGMAADLASVAHTLAVLILEEVHLPHMIGEWPQVKVPCKCTEWQLQYILTQWPGHHCSDNSRQKDRHSLTVCRQQQTWYTQACPFSCEANLQHGASPLRSVSCRPRLLFCASYLHVECLLLSDQVQGSQRHGIPAQLLWVLAHLETA